jgi:hypothetical protein
VLSSEDPFADAVVQALERREPGIAQRVAAGPQQASDSPPVRVLLDRQSYLERFLLAWVRGLAMKGTYVVNNPFSWSADDKFLEAILADHLGIPTPRTVLLQPQDTGYDLGGTIPVLDIEAAASAVGLPAVLKPFRGWGWDGVVVVNTVGELRGYYETSDGEVLLLQELVQYDHYVRVLVVGKKDFLPMRYDPRSQRVVYDVKHLNPRGGQRVVDYALEINDALDYDINAVEFALEGDDPVLIDAFNTVPDLNPGELHPEYFGWAVERTASFLVDMTQGGRRNRTPHRLPVPGRAL